MAVRSVSRTRQGSELFDENDGRYRRLVEGVQDYAILLLDAQGCIVNWPPAAERMSGYVAAEMLGRSFGVVCGDSNSAGQESDAAFELAAKEGKCEVDLACFKKTGDRFWADLAVASLRDESGKLDGFSLVMRDVTERQDAHQQRAQELAEDNRLKDEFLATVSHELRTPLNSILGWAQLLRSGRLDESNWDRAIQTIELSAKTQARLIDDLLDVSRIITGKMQLDVRPIRLSEIIRPAIETIQPAADAKGIRVETKLDSTTALVSGDPNRLHQVAWNLLSNAIKFTPAGGLVHVRLEHRREHVEMTVKDSGIGIKAAFLPFVFDAFRQADSSTTRAHQGLGLGLAIVRRLVELHGGTVQAESPGIGQGSTFRVRIPTASMQVAEASPVIIPSSILFKSLQGLRVVVVDDDHGARELASMILSKFGVQVTAVASASEGFLALRQFKPHVLLSDLEMPHEDGYSLIQRVRALCPEEGGETPAVALTAYARPEDRRRTRLAGFQIHLTKPIESDELASAIALLADQRSKGERSCSSC
jgi:PAS domain S-box-containing protein